MGCGLFSGLMGCGLFVGEAVEIDEVVRGGSNGVRVAVEIRGLL